MKLKDLLEGVKLLEVHADLNMDITGITYDSRTDTKIYF